MYRILQVGSYNQFEIPTIEGFNITIAKNIPEAEVLLDENFFDAMIVTVHLKGQSQDLTAPVKNFLQDAKKIDSIIPIFIATNKNTPELISFAYELQLFRNFSYPLEAETIEAHLQSAVAFNKSVLRRKKLVMRTKSFEQHYNLHDVLIVKRSGHRYVEIHSWQSGKIIVEDYFYKESLARFAQRPDVQDVLKQCHRNYLINPAHIVRIDKTYREIFLQGEDDEEILVPTTVNYINDFLSSAPGKKK